MNEQTKIPTLYRNVKLPRACYDCGKEEVALAPYQMLDGNIITFWCKNCHAAYEIEIPAYMIENELADEILEFVLPNETLQKK